MALEMNLMAARSDLALDPRVPSRQSHIRALLSEKKRKSRDNPVLRPDPFRYGNPNPLDCHPYINDKHPDYIVWPHTVQRPLSFPVFTPTEGVPRLNIIEQDDLDVCRAQVFGPRLLGTNGHVAILEFLDSNNPSRAMANSFQPARRPPEILRHQQKGPPTPPLIRMHSDVSLQDFVKSHEAAVARKFEEKGKYLQNSKLALLTPPPTPPKDIPCPSSRRPSFDTEPSIKQSSNSGLPKGWKVTHDRFIAYLDTHAPLNSEGDIPFRESKKPRYTMEKIISLLKERFVRFRSVPISARAIERRLEILDYTDNNYFNMDYRCYSSEVWGKGI